MTALPSDFVYLGFWTDHSIGPVLGATITLSTSSANVVLVTLTLVIAFAGSHLWDLVAFLNFLSKATDEKRDGIHHQIQLLLRNDSSPSTYAWECVKMAYYWRRYIRRRCSRLIYTMILALVFGIGFIAAGIVASGILSSGSVSVLVRSVHCGYYPDSRTNDSQGATQYTEYINSMSWAYSKKCYGKDAAKDPSCNIYMHPAINFTTTYDSCPFADACLLKSNPTLVMDTGIIDSNDVLGLNTKKKDTMHLRMKATCSVIDSDPYVALIPHSETGSVDAPYLPDQKDWVWKFGSSGRAGNISTFSSTYHCNSTTTLDKVILAWYGPTFLDNTVVWDPIPPFNRNDSDIFLIVIRGNAYGFGNPVNDPLFSAHTMHNITTTGGPGIVFYSDSPGKVLGCTEQYQFCTSDSICTSLARSLQVFSEARNLKLNRMQNATITLFETLISGYFRRLDFSSFVVLRIDDSEGGIIVNVPDNQWEIEAQSLFSLILASIQKNFADIATGPLGTGNDEQYYQYFKPPTDPEGLTLCGSQKMKAPNGFSNINVFGLAFTVGLCGLFILANITISPAMKIIARYSKPMSVGMRHWIGDNMLQVQRKAFERKEYSQWDNLEHDIPTTSLLAEFHGLAVCDEDKELVTGIKPLTSSSGEEERSLPASLTHQTAVADEDSSGVPTITGSRMPRNEQADRRDEER